MDRYDYPLAVMPAHSTDQIYPAVGWQMFAAERMVYLYVYVYVYVYGARMNYDDIFII